MGEHSLTEREIENCELENEKQSWIWAFQKVAKTGKKGPVADTSACKRLRIGKNAHVTLYFETE